MKFVSFYDEQMFVNADLIYEINIVEHNSHDETVYYFEFLMKNARDDETCCEAFVTLNDWETFEKCVSNFWEDMSNPNVIKVVPRS